MKFALASLLIGSAAAFSASPSAGYSTALRSTVTETYTFTKSEEIFAEAKNVSFIMCCNNKTTIFIEKGEDAIVLQ